VTRSTILTAEKIVLVCPAQTGKKIVTDEANWSFGACNSRPSSN